MIARWRGDPDDTSRGRLAAGCASVGPRVLRPLVARLGSEEPGTRGAAFELLRGATGLDHGFSPGAAAAERSAATRRWEEWIAANEARLRFDAATGRIVAGR